MADTDFATIGQGFGLSGKCLGGVPYGSGHINDTYAVRYQQGEATVRYIFQRINDAIFRDVPKLMDNIQRVTQHQHRKLTEAGLDDPVRRALTVIPTRKGEPYHVDEGGSYWRIYPFIEGAQTYDRIENSDQARAAAAAFARFQKQLADLPGERLYETIPDFHDTPKRLQRLEDAVAADREARVSRVAEEIAFMRERAEVCRIVVDAMAADEVPERVTHNDTKLNNVMIDDCTGEGICVIDLDTVMPGSVLYDFGDLVRTATSLTVEDDTNLEQVGMSWELFQTIAGSYLAEAAAFMTPRELDLLAQAGRLITLENAVRFLTDYLEGDGYFKTRYPDHNLDRCRNQMQMVKSIEKQLPAMEAYIQERARKCVS